MRVLVPGGTGFIGRHAVAALRARGHEVVVGTRRFETLTEPADWDPLLAGCGAVVNAVGILRERVGETYGDIFERAPAALATACARRGLRLIHVSALGLHDAARSRFILSKLAGERAIAASGARYSIVRPSLVDGEGGYGARWLRWVARWPVHFTPADARGRIAALDARDLGEAIAVLCEKRATPELCEVELGGSALRTMREYLAALRPATMGRAALHVSIPAWLARIVSHLCDFAHFSPFSFGHLELMRRDNAPRENLLPALLGRAPTPVGPASGWLLPCDGYGRSAVLRNAIPFFLLLGIAPLLNAWSPLAPWLLPPLIGLFAYRMTIVMHDCVHRSLFRSTQLNERVGRILGAVTGLDFQSFARQHLRHHRNYGEPSDPQGFHYLGLKATTRPKFAWHLLRPLLGVNLRYAFGESVLAPRNLRKAVRSGEVFVLVGVQAIILATVTGAGTCLWLAALPFVSAATFGLFFSQLRGIAEHAALGDADAAGNVRSHAPNWLDRIFLYDLNFNYHEAHHRYPQYSSCHLPAVHANLLAGQETLGRSMFCTIKSLASVRGRS